jgi:hypothetical protein
VIEMRWFCVGFWQKKFLKFFWNFWGWHFSIFFCSRGWCLWCATSGHVRHMGMRTTKKVNSAS